jgi:hypothetical protein
MYHNNWTGKTFLTLKWSLELESHVDNVEIKSSLGWKLKLVMYSDLSCKYVELKKNKPQ